MIAPWLLGVAAAFPSRLPPQRPVSIEWEPGRRADVLVVKLAEDEGLELVDGIVQGPGDVAGLAALLAGAEPLFPSSPALIHAHRETWDPEHRLADLTLYLRLTGPDVARRGLALLADPRVEAAYLDFEPVPPPGDLSPTTPDFSDLQLYAGPSPDGIGMDIAQSWPGGDGRNVTIANIEYGWQVDHEDLEAAVDSASWGVQKGQYAYHGTSVLGELIAGDNGFGVTGLVPAAEILMISPYDDTGTYNVAAAVTGAAALLEAGDVLLIEQQYIANGAYCPVETNPAVFDAIALAVAQGIVVVEPGGNGGQDLDAAQWEGWFDRSKRDSGAILVGGGASPLADYPVRTWFPYGSSYGERVDMQGWYDSIVTATNADYSGAFADLFFPKGDGRQGYTASFGGTSGASPFITAVAAVANSVAKALWQEPWDPLDLRQAMRDTGTPQPADDPALIGPQPDLRRLLRSWGVR